jgi:DNA-directed RNA polymerase specialized sigma24 family protein
MSVLIDITARLDRRRASSTVTRVSVQDELRRQDWKRISAELTAFAWKRTRKRSWALAEDIAQEAIAQVWARGAWDPAKEPLIKNLARRVISLSANEWNRKRNRVEVALDDATADKKGSGDMPVDERVAHREYAVIVHDHVIEHFADDEKVMTVVHFNKQGLVSATEMAEASGHPDEVHEFQEAKRRLRYYVDQLTEELSRIPEDHEPEQAP